MCGWVGVSRGICFCVSVHLFLHPYIPGEILMTLGPLPAAPPTDTSISRGDTLIKRAPTSAPVALTVIKHGANVNACW